MLEHHFSCKNMETVKTRMQDFNEINPYVHTRRNTLNFRPHLEIKIGSFCVLLIQGH